MVNERENSLRAKPLGPIPAGYGCIDGELAIDGWRVSHLIDRAGRTPCFVYSSAAIASRVAAFRAAMPPGLLLSYAVKANPFAPLLRFIRDHVDGFDIASAGELAMVADAGVSADRISFAGPGKSDAELRAAIGAGIVVNLESEGETRRAITIARQQGLPLRAALRVNPDFSLRGSGMKMGGGAKPFGIDVAQVPTVAAALLEGGGHFEGLHIYSGSQSLDTPAIVDMQRQVFVLADELARAIDRPLPSLNMGGGFGIPYFAGDCAIDLTAIGEALNTLLSNRPTHLANTKVKLELGRYLVAEAGVYLTTVLDRKTSHGHVYIVTDGGLHHQLAASGNFGAVVRRNYPVAIASQFDQQPTEIVSVVGRLCTPLDRLADNGHFPAAEPGDVVAVFCAGAYGATASPSFFLGHDPAIEMLI